MSGESNKLSVTVTWRDLRAEFTGGAEEVLASIADFLSKQIPAISLANKISVNYSVSDLIDRFGDLVKITPEGPTVWTRDRKLSDKELVALTLIANRIAYETGSAVSASVTSGQICSQTGLGAKSVSARLSEIVMVGHAERELGGNGTRYRITTKGISWLETILAKKKGKGS